MFGAAYLTGVAGSGKTSVLAGLRGVDDLRLRTFSYSERLGARLRRSQEELRKESPAIVTADLVADVDLELADFVSANRMHSMVVVDSHAVTDEVYGQRVIPFSPAVLDSLALDAIVCLWAEAAVIEERIARKPASRLPRSATEIDRAQRLQESVAVTYSAQSGTPLYVVDSSYLTPEEAQKAVASILRRVAGS